MSSSKPLIYVVCGPTAAGKSDYAMRLAEELNGALICMDAFQIYQAIPILSASPSTQDLRRVSHYLYSILSPLENFSLPQYYQLACDKVLELLDSGITPIFVGGAGLYMKVLFDGLEDSNTPENPAFRRSLKEQFLRLGEIGRAHV